MIYIFGHKKPDTDSVCSAIALSKLKNKLGLNTVPRILDEVNPETKFVLKKFGFDEPKILNDVKLRIRNINYKKDVFYNEYESILSAYEKMLELDISAIPIVDKNKKLRGLFSMKDIAKINFDLDDKLITSYQNILNCIEGKKVLSFDEEIFGNILVASYKSTTFIENVTIDDSTIMIVGDRHSVIEYAVNKKAKAIILTGGSEMKEEHLKIAKENKVNVIYTNYNTYKIAKIINYANYVSKAMIDTSHVTYESDLVDDFKILANRVKFNNYPVINSNDECLGLLRLSDLGDTNPEKVILVDHNELSQSAEGIEQAEITEVIDHHKIGDIASKVPINFRNMTVGSTCTIIYLMYKENNTTIDDSTLGLLMSGIISDTMLLNSPTTTKKDVEVLNEISNKLNIDYITYGKEMFYHGSSLKGKTFEEVIYNDFKKFDYNEFKIGIGQLLTTSVDEVKQNFSDYFNQLNEISKNEKYDILAFFVTDVIKKGSYMVFSENSKVHLEDSFKKFDLKVGDYFEGIVSRKTQIVPPIVDYLDRK